MTERVTCGVCELPNRLFCAGDDSLECVRSRDHRGLHLCKSEKCGWVLWQKLLCGDKECEGCYGDSDDWEEACIMVERDVPPAVAENYRNDARLVGDGWHET